VKKLQYLVIGLIIITVTYPLGSEYLERVKEKISEKNLESGVILYDLEGYQFDVPLKYYYLIYQKTNRWPTPKKERQSVKSFEIDVVLPNMLPFSEQTAEKFEARGWKDKMWITLWSHDNVIGDFGAWFNKNKHKYRILGFSNEAPSLIHIIDHRGGIIENDENYSEKYFKSVNDFNEYFYIQCEHESTKVFPTYPSCKLHTKYGELKLTLTFARKHMSDWEEILNNAVKLLDRFKVSIN